MSMEVGIVPPSDMFALVAVGIRLEPQERVCVTKAR
jgi:hypothetical protein